MDGKTTLAFLVGILLLGIIHGIDEVDELNNTGCTNDDCLLERDSVVTANNGTNGTTCEDKPSIGCTNDDCWLDRDGVLTDIDGLDVTARTKLGDVLGRRREEKLSTGGEVDIVDWYLGIPYAKAPIEARRFKPPVPMDPWSGERKAFRFGKVCPQPHVIFDSGVNGTHNFMSEDCLFLNVYVPYDADDSQRVYPVMVYIHGGSYYLGGSDMYTGSALAQHGVVVVTINYRLGLLGFWCGGDDELEGNFGLLDQIEALKWIRDNIRAFRGDPEAVTVFGNSAGASSAGILTVSPIAKGLFRNVIIQSGSPLSFWAAYHDDIDLHAYAFAIADVFGCKRYDLRSTVDCMRSVSWREIINEELQIPKVASPSKITFKPCSGGRVLPRPMDIMLERREVHDDVVIMIGTTHDEWSWNLGWFMIELFPNPKHDGKLCDGMDRESFERAIRHVVSNRFKWPALIADMIIQHYTNWTNDTDPFVNRDRYIQFFTDLSMIVPTVQAAKEYFLGGNTVFLYSFDHHSETAVQKEYHKSHHQIELNYLFGSPFDLLNVERNIKLNYTNMDRNISSHIMKLWTNFAKFRNPTPDSSGILPKWKQFLPTSSDYYRIGNDSYEMRQHLRASAMSFWTQVFPKLRKALEKSGMPAASYRIEMWVFVGISTVLTFLLVLALYFILKRVDLKQGVTTVAGQVHV